jgi:ubiquitin carboxyl-terminal hydrolase 30
MITGLKNFGNVCYLNAIIQALASCSTLLDFLSKWVENLDGCSDNPLATHLLALLQTLNASPTTGTASASAKDVWHWLQHNTAHECFAPNQEHDAAEALAVLLSLLASEANVHSAAPLDKKEGLGSLFCAPQKVLGAEPDVASIQWQQSRLPCEGRHAVELQCLRCTHKFATQFTPFLVLPLPLEGSSAHSQLGIAAVAPGTSLRGCLRQVSGYEVITGATCAR